MTDVLIVVAHPDDAEIAMGMRILNHAQRGDHVRVHCLSPGAADPEHAARRHAECLQAGALLGIAQYTFSRITDNAFTEQRVEINRELFRVFGERRPDLVYTHFPHDQHLDHQVTAHETTAVALREADNLSYFRSPYSNAFDPTDVFVGTPALLQAKTAALACFTSQHQLDMDTFTTLATVAYRQHVHHRVVERFPPGHNCAELFRTRRAITFAAPT
ncbi:PIG-L family deacetylase [Streptomyces sp. NPDC001941]|uniref:PIG-L deacetylase family protein n=1 Tax=Streptomyces sp. NPDC001941 TaxID=3154659 RepID=UPI0033269738